MHQRFSWMVRLALVGLALTPGLTVGCVPPEPDETDPAPVEVDPCGEAPWGPAGELPDQVYVATWGSWDGEGTRDDPLGSILSGLTHADTLELDGVVVAGGDDGSVYFESVEFPTSYRDLDLRGRCAELVTIDASTSPDPANGGLRAAIRMETGSSTIQGLTLTGGDAGLVLNSYGYGPSPPEVHGEALRATGNRYGVYVSGGSQQRPSELQLAGCQISDNGASGVKVLAGGQVSLTDCEISSNAVAGVLAKDEPDGGTTTVTLAASRVADNLRAGVYGEEGAQLLLDDCEVDSNLPDPSTGRLGTGVEIRTGADVVVRRTRVSGNHGFGVLVRDLGSTATLLSSEVSETRPDDADFPGEGVQVADGAHLDALELVVTNNAGGGLGVIQGASARLDQVLVRGPHEQDGGTRGVEVGWGARLVASGLVVERTAESGLLVSDRSEAELLDVMIVENLSAPGSVSQASALAATYGSSVRAKGLWIEDVEGVGVRASGGSEMELADTTITEVRGQESGYEDWTGRGVYVLSGATVRADRLEVRSVAGAGVLVHERGSLLEAEDLIVTRVGPTRLGGEGHGVAVERGGRLQARGLRVWECWRFQVRTTGSRSAIELEDSTIGAASSTWNGQDSVGGINVNSGAYASLKNLEIIEPFGHPLFAWGGAVVHSENLHIVDQQSGDGAAAIVLQSGASLTDLGSLVERADQFGLYASGAATRVELIGTRIEGTKPNADGRRGRGIYLNEGAQLVGESIELVDNSDISLGVRGLGTRAHLVGGEISGTRAGERVGSGVGMLVHERGEAELVGTRITTSAGPAIVSSTAATVQGDGVVLLDNHLAGALVTAGGRLELEGGRVAGTRAHPGDGGGVGVFAHDRGHPAVLSLHQVDLEAGDGPALYLRGPVRADLDDCLISGPQSTTWLPGGLFAAGVPEGGVYLGGTMPVGTGLFVSGVSFANMDTAILLDRSTGVFDGNSFTEVQTPMWTQRCDAEPPPWVDGQALEREGCSNPPRPTMPLLSYSVSEVELVEGVGEE